MLIAAIGVGISEFAFVQSTDEYSPFGDDAIDLPDHPSIAILAFDNLSNDPNQDYLSDGIAEDLITSVSYLRGLLVIARHSALSYKGESIDVTQIGKELGVRHVLEVVEGEQARGWNRSGTDPEAYDLFLRAREAASHWSEESLHRSIALAERAIEIDPNFAMGWVQHGWGHSMLAVGGWSKNQSKSWEQATADARRALTLDPTLADAYTVLGQIYMQQGRHDEGIEALEKAAELEPRGEPGKALTAHR